MTLNDFELIMAGLRKEYEVEYDAESEHAMVIHHAGGLGEPSPQVLLKGNSDF